MRRNPVGVELHFVALTQGSFPRCGLTLGWRARSRGDFKTKRRCCEHRSLSGAVCA
jgi:hypothetical protein